MTAADQSNRRSPDLPLDQVKPYRSPVTIPEPSNRRLKPLFAWAAVVGLLAGGCLAYVYARYSAAEGLTEHVTTFGHNTRSGTLEEPWDRGGDYRDEQPNDEHDQRASLEL